MSAAAIAKAMRDAGCTIDQIVTAIEKYEHDKRAKGRAGNARRQAEFRARRNESNAVTGVTDSNGNNAVTPVTSVTEPDASRVRVLCGEESKNIPPVILTDDIPQGGKREKRATRIPESWNPSDREISFAIGLGFKPDELTDARDEFREYWTREGGAKARKLDWDLTFRGRLRELANRRRLKPNPRAGPRGNGFGPILDELMGDGNGERNSGAQREFSAGTSQPGDFRHDVEILEPDRTGGLPLGDRGQSRAIGR